MTQFITSSEPGKDKPDVLYTGSAQKEDRVLSKKLFSTAKRECGECTKCCEGYLNGVVHGHMMWKGRPCQFQCSTGCEIYEDRPENPCKKFSCSWLYDNAMPAWMRPDKVNAIICVREIGKQKYVDVTETEGGIDIRVMSWLLEMKSNGAIENLRWNVAGGVNFVGNPEFCDEMVRLEIGAVELKDGGKSIG